MPDDASAKRKINGSSQPLRITPIRITHEKTVGQHFILLIICMAGPRLRTIEHTIWVERWKIYYNSEYEDLL
jgi:hypothetical protein